MGWKKALGHLGSYIRSAIYRVERATWDKFVAAGTPFRSSSPRPHQYPPSVVGRSRRMVGVGSEDGFKCGKESP